jgi:hypothetical protein
MMTTKNKHMSERCHENRPYYYGWQRCVVFVFVSDMGAAAVEVC